MLKIDIPETEGFDPKNSEFIKIKAQSITLEHSLVSISKWESKWHVPYLSTEKTTEQIYDYIRCMTLTQNVKPEVYFCIPKTELVRINDYIEDKMTATWFSEKDGQNRRGPLGRDIVTSEIIYYWMITLNIPMECQKWHLNRLLTLIRVCGEKNKPQDKMSKKDIMARNRALNEARRKQYKTRG